SIIDQTQPINNQANSNDTEQANEPNIYNNKTSKNNKNISIDNNFKIFNEEDFLIAEKKEMPLAFANTNEKKIEDNWQKKSSAKKKEIENPSIEQVKDYFKQEEYSEFEA